ncbi:fructose-specific PTS transporter subunit EIIC [Streptomyces sp. NPDC020951]|uniref:fructose-specific PTS transporter subunit EIIC n=1 Tax=Streptomyces sp. NPDC020951 TaxID=3365104 RepID=UPI00379C6383
MSDSRPLAAAPPAPMNRGDAQGRHIAVQISRWLLSGTPYLGALTALASALVVLAFALGGPHIAETATPILYNADWSHTTTWAALMFKTGGLTLNCLPIAIAPYVAYGMAGRPAMVSGFLGGVAAMGIGAGALGGLAAGLIAGGTTLALRRIPVPSALLGVISVALIPLLATVVTAFGVIAVAGAPLNALEQWFHRELVVLQFHNTLALGLLLGLLVCCDVGGNIARMAIGYGAVMVMGGDPSHFSTMNMTIMAAAVAAGMVPPLGMTLATLVRRKVFTEAERNYGKVSWLFGAAFIPEGSAPFVLADPLRALPASMAGGAVTGGLVMTLGATIDVPYGGFFAVDHLGKPLLFAASVLAGALVTAGLAVALKSLGRGKAVVAVDSAPAPRTAVPVAG